MSTTSSSSPTPQLDYLFRCKFIQSTAQWGFESSSSSSSILPNGSLLQHILDEGFAGFITTTDQWATSDVQEAHFQSFEPPHFECFWSDVLRDLHVALGRAHVLSEGDDVDVCFSEFLYACYLVTCIIPNTGMRGGRGKKTS